jgi:ParE toxin of type II toxin-antitoxin system, parDE
MIVEFEDEALAEIENAISYSEERFGTGERLNLVIQSSILRIAEDPFRFRKNHLGVCIHHLPPFPFYLVFESRKDSRIIRIYALGNTSRHPDYWKSRLQPLP